MRHGLLGERVRVRGEYLIIPKLQHLIPFSPEPFIAYLVSCIDCMLSAAQFYDEFLFEIDKIHNISANGLLPTKLKPFYLFVSDMPS